MGRSLELTGKPNAPPPILKLTGIFHSNIHSKFVVVEGSRTRNLVKIFERYLLIFWGKCCFFGGERKADLFSSTNIEVK